MSKPGEKLCDNCNVLVDIADKACWNCEGTVFMEQMSKSIDTLLEQLSATIALNHEGRKDGYGTVRKEDDMHIEDFKQAIYELLAGEAVWAKVLESTGDCGFIIRTEDAVPLSVLREVFGIKE